MVSLKGFKYLRVAKWNTAIARANQNMNLNRPITKPTKTPPNSIYVEKENRYIGEK
jgi:hypothetical protein